MIVNDDSCVINKLGTSLTDNARVVIYDHQVFIVQATRRHITLGKPQPYLQTLDLAVKAFQVSRVFARSKCDQIGHIYFTWATLGYFQLYSLLMLQD
jgi:hypothetical protein